MGRVLLAAPRGFCAGVERALEIIERLLASAGPPIYVRHEIVHNQRVIADLAARGVRFVDSEEDIPPGSICVLAAHGVPPAVRARAEARGLRVVDATCPLVERVHVSARRAEEEGRTILLIGHEDHGMMTSFEVVAPAASDRKSGDLDTVIDRTVASATERAKVRGAIHGRPGALRGPAATVTPRYFCKPF